jgi:hypothetical protein
MAPRERACAIAPKSLLQRSHIKIVRDATNFRIKKNLSVNRSYLLYILFWGYKFDMRLKTTTQRPFSAQTAVRVANRRTAVHDFSFFLFAYFLK